MTILPKPIKGIYLIKRNNNIDKEPIYYIGLSVDIIDRWKQHCSENKQYIDKSIHKYGYTNFIFSILEIVSKKKDLKKCETEWINTYKNKYDESLLYNISETNNHNPHRLDKNIIQEIKKLLTEDIGQSIYAISEKFNISWKEIVKIRKPLLKKKGMEYDNKTKNIIEINTKHPVQNWRRYIITKKLSDKILSSELNDKDDNDIANKCNISITDLKIFYKKYEAVNNSV